MNYLKNSNEKLSFIYMMYGVPKDKYEGSVNK